jgi:hypothetical protein
MAWVLAIGVVTGVVIVVGVALVADGLWLTDAAGRRDGKSPPLYGAASQLQEYTDSIDMVPDGFHGVSRDGMPPPGLGLLELFG